MIRVFLCVAVSLILVTQASTAKAASIVTEWLDQALPYAQEVAWEPTVGSRFFSILQTAIYDAWTAYDPVAVGVVSGTALKGQGGADNEANKREAISHAAFTVLRTFAPQHRRALIERMEELGYDPTADTLPAESADAALPRPFSPPAATTAPMKPATSPTRAATSRGCPDRRTFGGRSSRSASASCLRRRNGAASSLLRSHAPMSSAPSRRRLPEPPSGRGKSMC